MTLSLKQKVRTGFVVGVVLTVQMIVASVVLGEEGRIGPASSPPGVEPPPPGTRWVGPGPRRSAEEALWASCFPPPQSVLGLDEVIESLSITELCVRRILAILGNDYGLRYGIEQIGWNVPQEATEFISFEVKDMKVRDLLNKLVTLDPRYLWTRDGEYVNFILRGAYEADAYPFNANITKYEVEDMPYAQAYWPPLAELYETIGFGLGAGLRHPPDFGPTVTASMQNASLRKILNEVARQTDVSWDVGSQGTTKRGGILMARRMHVPKEAPFQWVGIKQILARAGLQVHWDPQQDRLTAVKGNAELQLQVGHEQAQLNIRKEIPAHKITTTTTWRITLPSAPRIVAGYVQVPELFAAQLLTRYRYYWDTPGVRACSEAEVAICTAPSESERPAQVITPDQIRVDNVGNWNWRREVHHVISDNVPQAQRLIVGETFNPPGNWSSYPPHKHDRDDYPFEVNMEEIYHFRLNPPQGFGIQRIYTDEGDIDLTYTVEDQDTVLLPRGYHLVGAAPGYQLYYLWMMVGPNERHMLPCDDPQHAWVKATGAMAQGMGF